jgi:hypothetical protein
MNYSVIAYELQEECYYAVNLFMPVPSLTNNDWWYVGGIAFIYTQMLLLLLYLQLIQRVHVLDRQVQELTARVALLEGLFKTVFGNACEYTALQHEYAALQQSSMLALPGPNVK